MYASKHRHAFTHGHTHTQRKKTTSLGHGVETYNKSPLPAELRGILLQIVFRGNFIWFCLLGLVQCPWTQGLYLIQANLKTQRVSPRAQTLWTHRYNGSWTAEHIWVLNVRTHSFNVQWIQKVTKIYLKIHFEVQILLNIEGFWCTSSFSSVFFIYFL